MKKQIAIIFIIGAFTLIAHDVIPHHHPAMEEYELNIIHIVKDAYGDHANKENDHDHDHDQPIPSHQHVYAPDDYFGRRNNVLIQKVIKITISNSICLFSYFDNTRKKIPQNDVFTSIEELPDPYPFIISPNAMRGSPSNG